MNYKTEEHLKSERKHLIKNRWQAVRTILLLITLALLSASLISYSIKKEAEIKALNEKIEACEARPPCKRELNK